MKISSRLDYGFSCIIRAADNSSPDKPVSVKAIARKENLEFDYTEKLLIAMKKGGVLKSVRGRTGGYVLSRPADEISARDIVLAIEKDTLQLVCFRKGRRRKCVHLDDCNIRTFWLELKDEMDAFLESYTLKDLLKLRRKERNW